jgi:very-short-patch-repair endonuclease
MSATQFREMTPAEVLAKEQSRAKREALELALLQAIRAHKLPEPWKQFKFHPRRKWRFDFCWPIENVAVEVDGGTHSGGRHTRGAGHAADAEKRNEAQLMGWRVLVVTSATIKSGQAIDWIKRGLEPLDTP